MTVRSVGSDWLAKPYQAPLGISIITPGMYDRDDSILLSLRCNYMLNFRRLASVYVKREYQLC